jgi:hypothetical protein
MAATPAASCSKEWCHSACTASATQPGCHRPLCRLQPGPPLVAFLPSYKKGTSIAAKKPFSSSIFCCTVLPCRHSSPPTRWRFSHPVADSFLLDDCLNSPELLPWVSPPLTTSFDIHTGSHGRPLPIVSELISPWLSSLAEGCLMSYVTLCCIGTKQKCSSSTICKFLSSMMAAAA